MKKAWIMCLLVLALSALLCVTASAASGDGTIRVTPENSDASFRGLDTSNETQNDSFDLTYNKGKEEETYILYVFDEEAPASLTADFIEAHATYMDQENVDSGKVSFTVEHTTSSNSNATYYVYIVERGGSNLLLLATYTYEAGYKLGDVNEDTLIDSKDALAVLQIFVGLAPYDEPTSKNLLSGDVNLDGAVDSKDSLAILQYFVGIITDFSQVQHS